MSCGIQLPTTTKRDEPNSSRYASEREFILIFVVGISHRVRFVPIGKAFIKLFLLDSISVRRPDEDRVAAFVMNFNATFKYDLDRN